MGILRLKKFILVFLILILCGCNVTYELEIKDNVIYENSDILVPKEKANNLEKNGTTLEQEINYTFESFHDVENNQEENKTRNFLLEKIDNANHIGLKYSNQYAYKAYNTSPIIKQCYEDVIIEFNDDILSINTSDYFKCFEYYEYIDNIKISLKTRYDVLAHNADDHEDNYYFWNINKNNYSNKNIKVKIDTSLDIVEYNEKTDEMINIGLISLGIVLGMGFVFVLIKFKTSNKK